MRELDGPLTVAGLADDVIASLDEHLGEVKADDRLILRHENASCGRCCAHVPGAGLEPACPCGQSILSAPCLPFHHPGERV